MNENQKLKGEIIARLVANNITTEQLKQMRPDTVANHPATQLRVEAIIEGAAVVADMIIGNI